MRLLAALLLVPTVTFGVTVESLPPSEYADTEVTTNSVEVSIGADADGDGCLSLDETDYAVGYRCGVWFQRDAVADQEVETVGGGGQSNLTSCAFGLEVGEAARRRFP